MATERLPNILLVMFDQMSAQSPHCYGQGVVQTPHLQALALPLAAAAIAEG